MNSLLKVGAGIVLGGGIVLSALTFNGEDTLNTADNEIKSYVAKAEQVVQLYKAQKQEIEQMKANLEAAGITNTNLENELANLQKNYDNLDAAYQALLQSSEATEAEKEELQNRLNEVNANLDRLSKELETAQAETAEASEALSSAQANLENLQADYDVLYDIYEQTTKTSVERGWEIQRLEGEVEKANSQMDEANSEIQKANDEIEKANKAVDDFKNNLDETLDESIFDGIIQ
ncbi:hypothetical protein IEO70_05160 [Bacillus sp. AGMB 02131]|uniref:Uncharacterized protein n=1 Tax=Peribacillus faecalis TaxID=2772559 RepID=A0A927CV50_9BACI|nr:hypothetical protein [Peribacillus faecalis]MBD3107749.1 hypothetical protein [Peribacillus faecalis]